jgi:hypothetical protein
MKKAKSTEPVARQAYTIREFCKAYGISKAELYRMWEREEGPLRTRIGQRGIIITIEDATAWSRRPDLKVASKSAA